MGKRDGTFWHKPVNHHYYVYDGVRAEDAVGVTSYYEGECYCCVGSPWPSDIAEFYKGKLLDLREPE